MAAGSAGADKENAGSPTSSAAAAVAVPRRHGSAYAVKSCGVKKRPSRARLLGRVPLRDITNLVAASSAVAGPEAPLGQEVSPDAETELARPVAVLPEAVRVAAALDGVAGAPGPKKAARYSLRKGFR
ncbi:hypothetical protein BS78_10G154200 [Paspalum vaginatum]|nr:hypothetical protein BS78_10G154200 [Paspalum vaginatum]